MQEVILEQIRNNVPALVLSFVVIIIPVIVAVLISRDFEADAIKIVKKVVTYLGLAAIIFMGSVSLIPVASLTVNLIRDYNQPTILTQEGIIDSKSSTAKIPVIDINGEQFILSSKIGSAKTGEYCKIEYFKYSKYVYTISKEEQ